jgi:pyruvate dehydrogenase E1 component beta subunit
VPEESYEIPIGKADVKRAGSDVVVVTVSAMCHTALKAAEQLAGEGIEVEVLDLRSLAPLDEDAILESLAKCGRLVVLDEDLPRCGIASDVAAVGAGPGFASLKAPVERVTAPDVPVPFSPPLEKRYIPDVERTVAAIRRVLAA